ncbi:MAG: MarR family winged helix-turn-helix transcriptional regulator [Candidatus Dormibacteraceae bacterium]
MVSAAGRPSPAETGVGRELAAAAPLRRRFRQAQLLMSRALAHHRLSVLQYHLLLEVAVAGTDGLIQGRLSGLLACPEGRVSALVREMVDRGLMDRHRLAPDRRVVRLRLTARGLRTVVDSGRRQRQVLVAMVREIPPEELRLMTDWAIRGYLGFDVRGEDHQPALEVSGDR